jgi:AAA domain
MCGIPALCYGLDPNGNAVTLRIWKPIGGGADQDLLPFWQYELRTLAHLKAIAGSLSLLAVHSHQGVDLEGHHLVYETGSRRLLGSWFSASVTWQVPRTDAGRAVLWRNIGRLSEALALLHTQGITHRNLNVWSVLTANSDTADFQLTGFEWSTRLRPAPVGQSSTQSVITVPASDYGFARDWRDLGRLVLQLLGIPEGLLLDWAMTDHEIDSQSTPREITLLRRLLTTSGHDARKIIHDAAAIAGRFELTAQDRTTTLSLYMRLGQENQLSNFIQSSSEGTAPISDVEAQRRFVEQDLAEGARAIAMAESSGDDFYLLLEGRERYYEVVDYINPTGGASRWSLAYCGHVFANAGRIRASLGEVSLGPSSIKVIVPSDPYSPSFMQETGAWLSLRARFKICRDDDAARRPIAQSFLLLEVIHGCLAASMEFPVETVTPPRGLRRERSREFALHIRARDDKKRERLSALLGHRHPLPHRLADALTGQASGSIDAWHLLDDGDETERDDRRTEWHFIRATPTNEGQVFTFIGTEPAPRKCVGFLVPADSLGSAQQLRRQMKSWRALCEQGELLELLTRPRNKIKRTSAPPQEDALFKQVDADKQSVLRDVMETLPLFLVQGPPGVGKTFMVSELARQLLVATHTTRIVFAAQSHAAVDHMLKGIVEACGRMPPGDQPLIVRCRAQESDRPPSEVDVSVRAVKLAQQIRRAPLLAQATSHLQQDIEDLAQEPAHGSKGRGGVSRRLTARPIESLILRSANLVFGTTNCASLEQLLAEQAHFDWSVVEEAAKATGVELLNALLLAPRRLMIGDHRQLPPFDADRILKVLGDRLTTARLLAIAPSLNVRHFYDSDIRDLLYAFRDDDDSLDYEMLEPLCQQAAQALLLFAHLTETQTSSSSGFVRMLSMQHRMHPAIAKIVSNTFYEGKLQSAPRCVKHYETHAAPLRSRRPPEVPIHPVLWVDMPWGQEQKGHALVERRPGPRNHSEVSAVLEMLAVLEPIPQPQGKQVSLAILSPYRAQVRAIEMAIARAIPALRARLSAFAPIDDKYVHTVDSFQGHEADVVIVSLVRNNHHGSLIGALGFLADERRMNVLLSRARWQLVVIGSRRMLEEVVSRSRGTEEEGPADFLKRLLTNVQHAVEGGVARMVSGSLLSRVARSVMK